MPSLNLTGRSSASHGEKKNHFVMFGTLSQRVSVHARDQPRSAEGVDISECFGDGEHVVGSILAGRGSAWRTELPAGMSSARQSAEAGDATGHSQ